MVREAEEGGEVARLISRSAASADLLLLTIETTDALRATYQRAGQYVRARIRDQQAFFALASGLTDMHWQVLLRGNGGVASQLVQTSIGSAFFISRALGAGFGVELKSDDRLVLAVSETGFGVARALLRSRAGVSSVGPPPHVYVGARTQVHIPLANELVELAESGVRVTVCLSDQKTEGYEHGFVHDAILRDYGGQRGGQSGGQMRDKPLNGPSLSYIFVVGNDAMMTSVRKVADDIGLGANRVYTNY